MTDLKPKRIADRSSPQRCEKVCIVQVRERHTALLGYFLSYFLQRDVELVHRFEPKYSYVLFFELWLVK